jgi:hypothetical protein
MQAAEPERIVVTPLQAQRLVDEGLVVLLGDLMLTELDKTDYKVLGYSDMEAMLDNEAQKSLADCEFTSCLAELGDAMGANLLLHSNLGKIGEMYLINLKLIDVEKAAVRKRVTRRVTGDEGTLVNELAAAVAELMEREPPPPIVRESGGGLMPWAIGGTGVVLGLAGVAAGVSFGVLAVNELKFSPADPRYEEARQSAQGFATASTVSWIAAGAVTAAGVVAGGLMMME